MNPGLIEALEAAEVVLDFGSAPVLGTDEAAADDSFFVDDVGFGRACSAEGEVGFVSRIENDSHVVELVIDDVLAKVGGIAVKSDGEDDKIRELVLKLFEGGPLSSAVNAPRSPEIEHDDLAAVLRKRDGLVAVVNDEVRRGTVDVDWVGSAIAASGSKGECGDEYSGADCARSHVSIIGLAVQAARFACSSRRSGGRILLFPLSNLDRTYVRQAFRRV